jgi:NADH:ubiquinone oxidoreductase subunit 6 (subunit J)
MTPRTQLQSNKEPVDMTILQIIFLLAALVTLICAVNVVITTHLIHSAFWLVGTLLGVAVLFALLESRFYVVVQVLVYIGAISILIIFAVMLTRRVMDEHEARMNQLWVLAFLPTGGVLAGLIYVLSRWPAFYTNIRSVPQGGEDIEALGKALVAPTGFMLPFEVSSVLLLAALIGAIYIAADRKGGGH